MIAYAEQEGFLTKQEIVILQQIRDVVKSLPQEKELVSCHLLARAIGKFFELTVKDGYFASPAFPHSWLVNQEGKIYDVYPIAQAGGPVLLDNFWACPWPKLFVEEEIADLVDDEFTRRLQLLEASVEATMKKMGLLSNSGRI